jgi:hypothetical protein
VLAPNLTFELPAQQAEDVLSVARFSKLSFRAALAAMNLLLGTLNDSRVEEWRFNAAFSRLRQAALAAEFPMWKTGGNPVIPND